MITASLYFHIPYCKQACHYCDFHFSTQLKTKPDVLRRMHEELSQRAHEPQWQQSTLQSLYFGGGTPSLLTASELGGLIDLARKHFKVAEGAEITLEANPDDITPERLREWDSIGVNRLSIGVQTFREEVLRKLNRAHSSAEAHQALQHIASGPIPNYTADLMYGLPDSTLDHWHQDLETLLKYEPRHFSAYALTVEDRTALQHHVAKGKVHLPDEEEVIGQFNFLRWWSEKNGFEHYELSNFARRDQHSKHNSHYWSGRPYLGIGAGAHSFDGQRRWWNVSNNTRYAAGEAAEVEELSTVNLINERLMTRLRTAKGFDWLQDMPHAPKLQAELIRKVEKGVQKGYFYPKPTGFSLRPEHWMQSDRIIGDLFFDPEVTDH